MNTAPPKYRPLVLFAWLTLALSGCVGQGLRSNALADATPEQSDESIRFASASSSQVTTFTDSSALQYGCGEMDPGGPPDFQMTPSGLRYRVLRGSKGRKATATSTVTVKYRGWLDSGKEFDSSYDRGEPSSFPLNGVIPGWTEGMQLVGEGGMIELWVPAGLGYGKQGSGGGVPPNATLHFIVEVLSVQ